MKEKIFKALRDSILIGGKTSVSDETINIYVGLIDSEKITDESQIAEAIKPFVPALKAVQANINSVAATSSSAKESELKTKYEKEIEDLKKANPDTTKQDPPKEKTDIEKTIEAAFASYSEKVITPLVDSIKGIQGEKLQTSRYDQLKGKLDDAPAPYRDKILKDFHLKMIMILMNIWKKLPLTRKLQSKILQTTDSKKLFLRVQVMMMSKMATSLPV